MSIEPQNINKKITWESECEEGEPCHTFMTRHFGCFYKLTKWHRDFFHSLKFSLRLEQSLSQIHYDNREAIELFENTEYDRNEGLRSIMEIRRISEMIFPLVMYGRERNHLEKTLIACIEYEGMRARGVNWWSCDSNLAEFELDDLSQNQQQERLDKYSGVVVHIDDIEKMINNGAIDWRSAKYLKVWRYYLEERVEKSKPVHNTASEKKITKVDNIPNWEKRIIDSYLELGTVRKVQDRKIVREDTGKAVGRVSVARVIKEYNENVHKM